MKDPIKDIIDDLTFLAEKAQEPLVKIAYAMAITIIKSYYPDKYPIN